MNKVIDSVERNVSIQMSEIHPLYYTSNLFLFFKKDYDDKNIEQIKNSDEILRLAFYSNGFQYSIDNFILFIRLFDYWEFTKLPSCFMDFIHDNATCILKIIGLYIQNFIYCQNYLTTIIDQLSQNCNNMIAIYKHFILKYQQTNTKITKSENNLTASQRNLINQCKENLEDMLILRFNDKSLLKIGNEVLTKKVRYTCLFYDLVTKDFIDLNNSSDYKINQNFLLIDHRWRIGSDFNLDFQENSLLLEILPHIDLNKTIVYPFTELDKYINTFFDSDSKKSIINKRSFSPFEYYVLSLQFSYRYIAELFKLTSTLTVFKYFHNHGPKMSMHMLFYLFPKSLLNTNTTSSFIEDMSQYAFVLGYIITILIKIDSQYYLPLLNDYVNWSQVEPIYWEDDGGGLLNHIKDSSNELIILHNDF